MLTGSPHSSGDRFPSPIYSETVLAVNFKDAQRFFLDSLLDLHYAHALMLARQGIVPPGAILACLQALDMLDRDELRHVAYDGQSEDLFFHVQDGIERLCGEENGGRLHTARSRNDIALTLYRMTLRGEILTIVDSLAQVRSTLLALAKRHIDTLIPAYTHTQPAQPTTFAHYLLAAVECFARDDLRLQAAFTTVNRSPLGACAITTTGFPIDRDYTAELLGFEGLQLNSFGAIAATDYVTETAGAIATAMVNLGKLVQDLLLWCNPALNFLRLSAAWVQISSIMPQKRNPVSLEHTRILASKALAQAQGVFTTAHNTPFGDIVDSEDDLQPLVFAMTSDAQRALRLFAGLMADCEVDVDRLSRGAHDNFLTATELADTLVREESLSFHAAHRLVSATVRALDRHYSPGATVDTIQRLAREQLGRDLRLSREELLQALDPRRFVSIRTIPGGPAYAPVEAALRLAEISLAETEAWLKDKRKLLAEYPERIRRERNLVEQVSHW
ncbi:MAG: argininosuccinate lyase [Bryobacteraceae bacterium]